MGSRRGSGALSLATTLPRTPRGGVPEDPPGLGHVFYCRQLPFIHKHEAGQLPSFYYPRLSPSRALPCGPPPAGQQGRRASLQCKGQGKARAEGRPSSQQATARLARAIYNTWEGAALSPRTAKVTTSPHTMSLSLPSCWAP